MGVRILFILFLGVSLSCLNIDKWGQDPCDPNNPGYDASGCYRFDAGGDSALADSGSEDSADADWDTQDADLDAGRAELALFNGSAQITSPIYLGPAAITYEGLSKELTLKNIGTLPASLNGMTLAPVPFELRNSTCGPVIGANESCTFEAFFLPPARGLYNATLTIFYHDGQQDTFLELGISARGTGAWVGYGGSASERGISNTDHASNPSMALDKKGYPVIAWQDKWLAQPQIYVKRWNGAAWVEYGESARNYGISYVDIACSSELPALALDKDDRPIVTWQFKLVPTSSYSQIFSRYWNGQSWVAYQWYGFFSDQAGGISNTVWTSQFSSLSVINNTYKPIVAWENNENPAYFDIYAKYWNGLAWVEYSWADPRCAPSPCYSAQYYGISMTQEAISPSLAIDNAGNPIIAWHNGGGWVGDIYVKRWNGSLNLWQEYGNSASGGGVSQTGSAALPSLAVNKNGFPVVAWTDLDYPDFEILVKGWNGHQWVQYKGSGNRGGISEGGDLYSPSLVTDNNGYPVVVWKYGDFTPTVIYIMRWNGSAWVEIGPGSASEFGISGEGGDVYVPVVGIDNGGYPVVAWESLRLENRSIFVKYWKWDAE